MCLWPCVIVCLNTNSITPPKPPMFDDSLSSDPAPASEEKGMSIPVIGSSEYQFVRRDKKTLAKKSEEILRRIILMYRLDFMECHLYF